jgi:hypothetical protein
VKKSLRAGNLFSFRGKVEEPLAEQRSQRAPIFRQFEQLGTFARVHLDFFDGQWTPEIWDDGGGPDAFEIEIGNRVAWSAPLWENRKVFADLRTRWLPWYGEELRRQRLKMVTDACLLDFDRIHAYARRGLIFYAFDRLSHAFQEFLQAIFIAHRTYPLAYNKWIREQVEEILGLPALYAELPPVLEIEKLQPEKLIEKAEYLRRLSENWLSHESAK